MILNKAQQEVERLATTLPPITAKQFDYGHKHSVDHYALCTPRKARCMDCGHEWALPKGARPYNKQLTCPKCRHKLLGTSGRSRKCKSSGYMHIVDVCDRWQVVRTLFVSAYYVLGDAPRYSVYEVVQRWWHNEGRGAVVYRAKSRLGFTGYYDSWALSSELRVRPSLDYYNLLYGLTYPYGRVLPEYKLRGAGRRWVSLPPDRLLASILYDSRCETLLKAGQMELCKLFIQGDPQEEVLWTAAKICMRNGYIVKDGALWCDYVLMLNRQGRDVHNAHYVCPPNLKRAHDALMAPIRAEKKKREKELIAKREGKYREFINPYRGIVLESGTMTVRPLLSVKEFAEEGEAMKHCVYRAGYYERPNSLILTVRIKGKRVETAEIDLRTGKVVQCFGKNNSLTDYHGDILKFLAKNKDRLKRATI